MGFSVKSIVEFVIGIAMLPIAGSFAVLVSADPNLTSIMGLSLIITLGVVVLGLGIIYSSVKQMFGK